MFCTDELRLCQESRVAQIQKVFNMHMGFYFPLLCFCQKLSFPKNEGNCSKQQLVLYYYQSLTHINLVDTQRSLTHINLVDTQRSFFGFLKHENLLRQILLVCLFGNWWHKQRSVLSDKNLVLSRWNHQWLFCDHHNLTVLIATISCLVVSDPALEAQTVPLHIQH